MEYGLIGGRLGHSYSKVIHEMLCGYRYDLCPLPTEEEVRAFMTRRQFRAINVTIPYKLVVMEYCSYIDPHAKAINAVNTIVNRNGLLYGYNTDYPGFSYLCDAHGVEFKDRTVLILGTGGTHNTVTAVCQDAGAKQVLTASRTGKDGALTYEKAQQHPEINIIINTTPAGMLCQNTKGAANRPGMAAQQQSTARPRGGMMSAVRRSSRSVTCCSAPRHRSAGAGYRPASAPGCGPRAAERCCRGG